jgi:hypothetical protein
MKKTILIALLALGVLACKKDKQTLFSGPCNCGEVLSDRASDYSVVIRNSCTDRVERFTLQPSDWLDAHPGSDFCLTNYDSWRVVSDTLTIEERVKIKYDK